MTQEEKAKCYDIALDKIKMLLGTGSSCSREELEYVFPELKESEDERIVKELLTFFRESIHGGHILTNKEYDSWIAWLEKQGGHAKFINGIQVGDKVTRNEDGVLVNLSQLNRVAKKDEKKGEQKPAVEPKFKVGKIKQKPAWSEEDENGLSDALWCCKQAASIAKDENDMGNLWYAEHWLKSLKERVQPQPKQEWSEEDKDILFRTINDLKFLRDTISIDPKYAINIIDIEREITWLNSLRPQNKYAYNPYKAVVESIAEMCKHYDKASHSGLRDFYDNVKVKCKDAKEYDSLYPQNTWKPSEEQMKALSAVNVTGRLSYIGQGQELIYLYNDLKKLKEE